MSSIFSKNGKKLVKKWSTAWEGLENKELQAVKGYVIPCHHPFGRKKIDDLEPRQGIDQGPPNDGSGVFLNRLFASEHRKKDQKNALMILHKVK